MGEDVVVDTLEDVVVLRPKRQILVPRQQLRHRSSLKAIQVEIVRSPVAEKAVVLGDEVFDRDVTNELTKVQQLANFALELTIVHPIECLEQRLERTIERNWRIALVRLGFEELRIDAEILSEVVHG